MSTTRGSFRFHLFRHVFQIGWDTVDKDGSKKSKNSHLEKINSLTVEWYDGLKEIVRLRHIYILLR